MLRKKKKKLLRKNKLHIDTTNKVSETNETDNCKTTSFIAKALPTLTATPPIVTQKVWRFNIIAECPEGKKLKSTYKPGWYWWDNVDKSDADVSTVAQVAGASNRTFYITIFDNGGIYKPSSVRSGMTFSGNNVTWKGSYNSGTYTIKVPAHSFACQNQ